MDVKTINLLDYHLKKAKPEKYLDTLVNLMCSDFVYEDYFVVDKSEIKLENGILLRPISLWEIDVDGLLVFLSDLSEEELYNLFVNFYAYYRYSKTVTQGAMGIIILSAIFVGVSYKIPRFTTALQHVDINIVSKLFNHIEDYDECLTNLVSWYFDEAAISQTLDISIKHRNEYELRNAVNKIIDDLVDLCSSLFIALGNYLGPVFGSYDFYVGMENTIEDLLGNNYMNIALRNDTWIRNLWKAPEFKEIVPRFISTEIGVIGSENEKIPGFRYKVFRSMANKGYIIQNGKVIHIGHTFNDINYFKNIIDGRF